MTLFFLVPPPPPQASRKAFVKHLNRMACYRLVCRLVKLKTLYIICVLCGMFGFAQIFSQMRVPHTPVIIQKLEHPTTTADNKRFLRQNSSTWTVKDRNPKAGSPFTTTSGRKRFLRRNSLTWTVKDWNPKAGSPFWQWVDEGLGVLVYSAHFDDILLPPLVRLVGLARYPLPYGQVTCNFYDNCRHCPVLHTVSGVVYHHRPKNGRRYIGAFVDCPLDGLPRRALPYAVSVVKADDTWKNITYTVIHYSGGRKSAKASLALSASRGFSRKSTDGENGAKPDANADSERDRSAGRLNTGTGTSSGFRWNITRCAPSLHNKYHNHVLLSEMVAASRALGVDHFAFYLQSSTSTVIDTLKVLEARGLASIYPWNIHFLRSNLFYAGQFSSIQDCLYRHLRSSKYLLFGDVDELFVPYTSGSLVQLLDRWFKEKPQCGSFMFLNSFVDLNSRRSAPKPAARSHRGHTSTLEEETLAKAQEYQLTMLLHNVRAKNPMKRGKRSKPALDPRRVEIGSIHVISKMRPGSSPCVMKPDQGLLLHYRHTKTFDYSSVKDDTLWERFAQPVLNETLSILQEVDIRAKKPQ